jgi:hypothetical protein
MAVAYMTNPTNPQRLRIVNGATQSVTVKPKISTQERRAIEERAVARAMEEKKKKNAKRNGKTYIRNPNVKALTVQAGYAVLGATINAILSRMALNFLPGEWRRRRLAAVGVQAVTAVALGFAAEKIVGRGANADAVTIGGLTLPANTLVGLVLGQLQKQMNPDADAVDDIGNVLEYDRDSRRYYLSDGTPYDGDDE